MMINDSKQFREIIPYKSPILGIDLGTKRIGMAISDINQKIASPFKVEENKNFSEMLNINFTIENITNRLYRPYSSGISAPGLNFIFSVNYC